MKIKLLKKSKKENQGIESNKPLEKNSNNESYNTNNKKIIIKFGKNENNENNIVKDDIYK